MTGKVLENSTAGILVLILPIAMVLVVVFTAWPLLLLLLALGIGLKFWDNYQWQQWSRQLNPYFMQLIKENQGCLTVTDLSLKANLTGRAAKSFLDRKAEEYGAQRKDYHDKGTVYYFLTVSALGSIFEDSDRPSDENEEAPSSTTKTAPATSTELETEKPVPQTFFSAIAAQLTNQKEATSDRAVTASEAVAVGLEEPPTELTTIEESPLTSHSAKKQAMIQADLAKRLDINPSTVGRRKSNPDFPEWSQSKDPEGIAWKYIPTTQMFVPLQE
jgi:hypothetical protein